MSSTARPHSRPVRKQVPTLILMHPSIAIGNAVRLHRRGGSAEAMAAIIAVLLHQHGAGDPASGLVASWLIGKAK